MLALSASPFVARALADGGHQPFLNGVVLERVHGRNAASVDIRWMLFCYPQLSADARFQYTVTLLKLSAPASRRELTTSDLASGTIRVRLTPGRYRADADPFFCLATVRDTKTEPERGQEFVVPNFCAWEAVSGRGSASTALGGGNRVKLAPFAQLVPGTTLRVPVGESVTLVNAAEVAAPTRNSRLVASPRTTLAIESGQCVSRGGWRIRLRAGRMSVVTAVDAPHEVVTDQVVLAGSANAVWAASVVHSGPSRATTVSVHRGAVAVRMKNGNRRELRAGARATFRD